MVSVLQSSIAEDNVFFGLRECARHAKKLDSVWVASDARQEIIAELTRLKIPFERADMTRNEISDKCTLAFFCEVFGIKK